LKIIILAAGKGERLEPITHTRPKSFVPLLDKPLIEYQIDILRKYADEIILVISKKQESYFSKLQNVRIVFQNSDLIGTAAALSSAKSLLKGNEEFLVIYGDVFFDEKIIQKLVSVNFSNVIVGVRVKNVKDYGVIVSDQEGNLTNLIEKPQYEVESNLVNAGIYKLSSEIFHYLDRISVSKRGELELTDAILLLSKNNKVKVIEHSGIWMDVGKPWQIIDLNKTLLDSISTSKIFGEIEEGVKIKGKVIIEEGARVKSGTYIEGPVYIGRDSEIGPNAYIRPYSVIGKNVKIGSFVEVKESVIMEGSKVPHLSYVGDSIICENVNLGAGTIIANLRFDRKEVMMNIKGERVSTGRIKFGAVIGGFAQTGINVSILPGIKIGAYAIIYPGVVVRRDVKYGEVVKF